MPLDPVARRMLDDFIASGRPNAHLLPVEQARANFEALFEDLRPGEPVATVDDYELPVEGGSIPARAYRPSDEAGLGLVVYFHGGGWLLGSVESHDTVCRALANASGAVVLNVGYRRAPEWRFPTAADDALAATRWAHANAEALGADASNRREGDASCSTTSIRVRASIGLAIWASMPTALQRCWSSSLV